MKRRQFIKLSSAASAFALAPYQLQASLRSFMPLIADCSTDRILILIRLDGGNDGLNTFIPLDVQYDRYATLRPVIKLAKTDILDLGDSSLAENQKSGLHKSLTGFNDLYQQGNLKIIQGVGYHNANKSHFRGTDIMASGNDGESYVQGGSASGWIGRFMETHYSFFNESSPYPLAIEIGSSGTSASFIGTGSLEMALNITGQDKRGFFTQFGDNAPISNFDSDYGTQLDFINGVNNFSNKYANTIINAFNAGTITSTYEDKDLPNQLKTVAKLISGGLQSKIYLVNLDGFDTHNEQGAALGSHADLLSELSNGVKAFMDDMKSQGFDDKVMGVTLSEFGRKIKENANGGTDHGEIAPMFVFGTGVNGGVLGTNPDLSAAVEENNYQVSNYQFDYRQVFGTLIKDFLGADKVAVDSAFIDVTNGNASFYGQTLDIVGNKCNTLSVNKLEVNNQWMVHPNPFKDVVNIKTNLNGINTITYRLYNTAGAVLIDKTEVLNGGELRVNLGYLSSGIYIFHIEGAGKKENHKVIKI